MERPQAKPRTNDVDARRAATHDCAVEEGGGGGAGGGADVV